MSSVCCPTQCGQESYSRILRSITLVALCCALDNLAALEDALSIKVNQSTVLLRELMVCGQMLWVKVELFPLKLNYSLQIPLWNLN